MVRRWSHLNSLTTLSFSPTFALKKKAKLRLFKSNVKFKYFRKLKIKYTKTNRTPFKRLKHLTSFLMLSHSFKSWTTDYQVSKNIIKFEYFFNVLPYRTYVYNYNFIKNNSEAVFYNTSFLLSANNSSILLPFSKYSFLRKNFFFFSGNGLATAWALDPVESDSPLFVPVADTYDCDLFLPIDPEVGEAAELNERFDFAEIFFFLLNLTLKRLIDVYQLLIFLVFFQL